MQNIGTTLQAGVALPFQIKGTVLQIVSSGESAGLTVQFWQGTRVAYEVDGVLTGWKLKPTGGFDSITIESATADTISAIVTAGDVDIQILDGITQIANTPANPVPVSVAGGNVEVTATNVGINNTVANPVPVTLVSEPGAPVAVTLTGSVDAAPLPVIASQGASVMENAPLPVPANVVPLLAAGARRAFRVLNAGTGMLAIGGNDNLTFAQAALVLYPGDMWEEKLVPQVAWFAISDVGTTATVEVIQ
jgi:hypothetical protein